jgi:hypothetical protein
LIAVMPVFAGAVTMLLTDKFFHTSFLMRPVVATQFFMNIFSGFLGIQKCIS